MRACSRPESVAEETGALYWCCRFRPSHHAMVRPRSPTLEPEPEPNSAQERCGVLRPPGATTATARRVVHRSAMPSMRGSRRTEENGIAVEDEVAGGRQGESPIMRRAASAIGAVRISPDNRHAGGDPLE